MPLSKRLEKMDEVVSEFEAALSQLSSSLALIDGFSVKWRHRFGNSAYDIVSYVQILKFIYVRAEAYVQEQSVMHYTMQKMEDELLRQFASSDGLQQSVQEEEARVISEIPLEIRVELRLKFLFEKKLTAVIAGGDFSEAFSQNLKQLADLRKKYWDDFRSKHDPFRELGITFKAMFYFIRSCQDNLYSVALLLLSQEAPKSPSMMKAVNNPRNPIAGILGSIPEYKEWFIKWREKRNKIKEGVGTGYTGVGDGLGVIFDKLDEKNNGIIASLAKENVVYFADIVEAISMTTLLIKTVFPLTESRSGRIK
jgi:hypothetical protein